ncbi:hypothetical protein [Microbacterium algeriense]|uniref:hypothetical protein n=1 Tax=Microbacterium algeriense TaxID=2615184 RepID=UPI0022E2BAA1|nr:hypothetical protein [Microbacterium algeriense]
MTNEQATYRRVLRRETHSPRTAPAVAVAAVGAVVLLAGLAGGVWWLVDPSFRASAARWFDGASALAAQPAAAIAVGAVLVLLAVLLLALAVLPGRRSRRARIADRTALLVDDGVIADAVAAAVARRTGAERGRVSVTMGRRTVTVRIVPTSGVAVDPAAAESAVHDTLAEVGFSSATRVVVSTEGVVA